MVLRLGADLGLGANCDDTEKLTLKLSLWLKRTPKSLLNIANGMLASVATSD